MNKKAIMLYYFNSVGHCYMVLFMWLCFHIPVCTLSSLMIFLYEF